MDLIVQQFLPASCRSTVYTLRYFGLKQLSHRSQPHEVAAKRTVLETPVFE